MNLKRRQELIDFDYIDKLNDEEKAFLNKFMGEWMGASFEKESVTHPSGTTYKRHAKANVMKKSYTKKAYNANNSRNRDIYAKKTSTGGMEFFSETELDDLREKDIYTEINSFENTIIEADLMRKNPQMYKEQVLDYIASFERKQDRDAEIKYYISIGQGWIFD
jgi:hypothetical protein